MNLSYHVILIWNVNYFYEYRQTSSNIISTLYDVRQLSTFVVQKTVYLII